MKILKYTSLALALMLSTSMSLAQDSSGSNTGGGGTSGNNAGNGADGNASGANSASSSEGTGQKVDCPAAGTESEASLRPECKTAATGSGATGTEATGTTAASSSSAAETSTGSSTMTMSQADCDAVLVKADKNGDGSLGGDEAAPYLKKLTETTTTSSDAMILDKTAFMDACMKGQFQGVE